MYSFDIAKKYLFGKDKLSAINGIAIVSFIAISLVSFGLIVVLSVFNGYVDIINKINSDIDPPMLIKLKSGRNFPCDTVALDNIKKQKGVILEPILYSKGVVDITGDHKMVFIQGIGKKYTEYIQKKSEKLDDFYNKSDNFETIPLVVGCAIYAECNNKNVGDSSLNLIVPRRVGLINPLAPSSNFVSNKINMSYILEQKREDIDNTIFMDIKKLSDILYYGNGEASAMLVWGDKSITKDFVERYLSDDFIVLDKSAQHPELNFIIKTEKLMTFFIMLFILLLAVFNVAGCVLMMMIEKRHDFCIMRSIGITTSNQKRVFRISGMIISLGGIIVGTVAGVLFVWLQYKYGLVYSKSGVLRQPIPVDLYASDVLYVILLSVLISYLLILYATSFFKRIQ